MVVLEDIETPKAEMDALWTFMKKKVAKKMNSKAPGIGSG
jgi:hypothetical protein